jgi:hypothetical protein
MECKNCGEDDDIQPMIGTLKWDIQYLCQKGRETNWRTQYTDIIAVRGWVISQEFMKKNLLDVGIVGLAE